MHVLAYALLVVLVVVVLGSMGWLTARSGRVNREVLAQAQQESPRLVEESKSARARAAARRDECRDLAGLPS